jgi:hypothetical protein
MTFKIVSILFGLFISLSAFAQQLSENYFEYVDIDDQTEKFTLKEGQLLRIWDDRKEKTKLYRYAALYKIYLGQKTLAVDLISDNIIGLTTLFPGCFTNFSTIHTYKANSKDFWELKEIKKPKKKGKTELIFQQNKTSTDE